MPSSSFLAGVDDVRGFFARGGALIFLIGWTQTKLFIVARQGGVVPGCFDLDYGNVL